MRCLSIPVLLTLVFSASPSRGADPLVCGDVLAPAGVTVADALAVLKTAVGQTVALRCTAAGMPLSTGQELCDQGAGSGVMGACPGNPVGQDADFGAGLSRAWVDNGDGTVSDVATGLVWEKLSDDDSIHDRDLSYSWANAFGKIASLNEGSFAGHDDWRLPNVRELETLRTLSVGGPPIASEFTEPCSPGVTVLDGSCSGPGYYWSSSTWSGNSSAAWVVLFSDGGTVDASLKSTWRSVRAVRGGL